MPEIKFKSAWLKAKEDVNRGDHIRFLNTGEQDKDDKWVFLVGVIPQGQKEIVAQKKFGLGKKNFNAVSKVYGTNSDFWLNKEMQVRIVKVDNPSTGEEVDSVRLTPPGALEGELEIDEE